MALPIPDGRNSAATSSLPMSRKVSSKRPIAFLLAGVCPRRDLSYGHPTIAAKMQSGQDGVDQALGVLAVPLGGAQQAADLAALSVEEQRRRQAHGPQLRAHAGRGVGIKGEALNLGLIEKLL